MRSKGIYILAARHITLKPTPLLHLLRELNSVSAYVRECAVTAGEGEEGIHVAMILKGYEQALGSQALIQGVMVMAMGEKKTVAPSQVGEYYR